jgi:hypothetical protein
VQAPCVLRLDAHTSAHHGSGCFVAGAKPMSAVIKSGPIRLAKRVRVEFIWDVRGLTAEWVPVRPSKLDGRLLCDYRRALGSFIKRLAVEIGNILVVEI